MDFMLRYRGALPAARQCAEEKSAIRSKLHGQLFYMSQAHPLLHGVGDTEIVTARMIGRRMDVEHLRFVVAGCMLLIALTFIAIASFLTWRRSP